jgi:hypothetical protein
MLYNTQHRYYCGVDLHARSMYVHIVDAQGKVRFDQDLDAGPSEFLEAIKPYRKSIVIGCLTRAWYAVSIPARAR